jgi:metallophosphoesterase (TIGR03767 family)
MVVPWLAVYGNHDAHLQGMARSTRVVRTLAKLGTKLIEIPAGLDPAAISKGDSHIDLGKIIALLRSKRRRIARDAERRLIGRPEFVGAHFASQGKPEGHGFSAANKADGTAYYRYDSGLVSVLVLDTVNEHGGYDGSLDRTQLRWLMGELAAAQAERRYVVVASHHTLDTLSNAQAPAKVADHRALGPEILRLLRSYSCVVLWVNGHTHTCTVRPHGSLWEVTSPSLVDWPQQGRTIELVRNANGTLSTFSVMFDHESAAEWTGGIASPGELASLSRTLSANDWQVRANTPPESPRRGTALDRNVELVLRDPFAS